MADEIREREDEGVPTFARDGVRHLNQRKYRRTTTPFPTLERASAVPRCSPTTPLELPFDAFTPPQNHSTASVFLLCGSSLLSCTPAVDRLMSESHVATNSGGVSLPDCIWKLTSLGRIVSCSSKSRVSIFQSQSWIGAAV